MRSRVLVILAFCTAVPALSVSRRPGTHDGVFAAVSSGARRQGRPQPGRHNSSTRFRCACSSHATHARPAHAHAHARPDTYPDADLFRLFRVRQLKLRERPVRWIGLDGLRIGRFVLGRLRTRRSLLRELRDRRGSCPAVHRCRRPAADDPGPDGGGSRPVRCRSGLAVHPAPPLPRQSLTSPTAVARPHGVTASPASRLTAHGSTVTTAGGQALDACHKEVDAEGVVQIGAAPLDEGDGHLHDVRVDVRGQ